MARKNRVSVFDGVYHVTARIAHKAMLLKPDEIKDRILDWVVSVAAFSGVEVYAFVIMDNHLHLFVHVPPVPERLWLDPAREPCAYAFGMRPPERAAGLWPPDATGPLGDCPPPAARPELGFVLSDEEMAERLAHLYGPACAQRKAKSWSGLRSRGLGARVDAEKAGYCRRMYNLSQYVKTLKERVSMWYNREYGHSGGLWEGRFHSGVVEKSTAVLLTVAAYVGFNPVKAGIARTPAGWRWSSYALAVSDAGERGRLCRETYARMLGRTWEEARELLESAFADRLPEGVSPEDLKAEFDGYDEDLGAGRRAGAGGGETLPADEGLGPDGEGPDPEGSRPAYRATQAIRATVWIFSHGAYIGRDMAFFRRVMSLLPPGYPREGSLSVRRCRAFRWELPPTRRHTA